jgi:hypothetical protein
MKNLPLILLVLFIIACGKKNVPVAEKKVDNTTAYSENLSEYRYLLAEDKQIIEPDVVHVQPIATTEPMYVNDKVALILANRAAKNRAIKYANGYRIQIYVGRDRKTVDDAKLYIHQTFPTINPYLSYSLPIYKFKLGDFLTKADAEVVFFKLKDNFPEAIIITDKIEIKKSFLR